MAEALERREVQVDTELAELHGRLAQVNAALDSNKLSLAYAVGIQPTYVTRTRREVKETAAELAAMLASKLADGKVKPWDERNAREMLAKREALCGERAAILRAMEPLNAEFAAKPWSRFFLVTSSAGGHIHSSMNCSTCRLRTSFGWLPELSGLSEKDAVEAHGTILCSVCFPTAPVEWTVGNAPAKPRCPGTGTTDYDKATYRRTGYSGNGYAVCDHCKTSQTVTKSMVLRAHAPKVEA
jgi:hypothetical protein